MSEREKNSEEMTKAMKARFTRFENEVRKEMGKEIENINLRLDRLLFSCSGCQGVVTRELRKKIKGLEISRKEVRQIRDSHDGLTKFETRLRKLEKGFVELDLFIDQLLEGTHDQ